MAATEPKYVPGRTISNQYVHIHGQRPGLAAIFLIAQICAVSCRALDVCRAPVTSAAFVASTAFVASAECSSALVASAESSSAFFASAASVSVAGARIDSGGAGAAHPRRLAMDRDKTTTSPKAYVIAQILIVIAHVLIVRRKRPGLRLPYRSCPQKPVRAAVGTVLQAAPRDAHNPALLTTQEQRNDT